MNNIEVLYLSLTLISYQLYLVHVILKTSHDCAIKITKKKKKNCDNVYR